MSLAAESQQLVEKFRRATKALAHSLVNTKSRIMREIGDLPNNTERMEDRIE